MVSRRVVAAAILRISAFLISLVSVAELVAVTVYAASLAMAPIETTDHLSHSIVVKRFDEATIPICPTHKSDCQSTHFMVQLRDYRGGGKKLNVDPVGTLGMF